MEGTGHIIPAPHFGGTSIHQWKVYIGAYLQARVINLWRVVSEGIKHKGSQEKQYDVIAKSIILSSLSENIFNHVQACKDAHELWKTIIENHEGTKAYVKLKMQCSHWKVQ